LAIRLRALPTWILLVLILTCICPGCARRNIFLESKKDPMPCTEYGGKVSVSMRAPPAMSDRKLAHHGAGTPVPPVWSDSIPVEQSTPPTIPVPTSPAPAVPGPSLFAPPSLGPPPITQTSFDFTSSTENTIFASYPGPLPHDPAYERPPTVGPPPSTIQPPRLDVESLDIAAPMDTIASCDPAHQSCLARIWCEARQNVCCDYRNYYNRNTMAKLACGLVLGSVLANTSMDQDVQDWYQQDVRSEDTDNFSEFWKTFGEGHIFIPSYACLALAGAFVEDWPVVGPIGDFGARTTRAYLVGAPPMLFMQFMLGASRPGETNHSSHWMPFEDTNSVSGHAFIGAVPFITAAKMTDSVVLKSGLYACSTLTGYSRINDNCHYLSQVVLGWWMAYLACEAIDQTELNHRGMMIMPIASNDSVGFGAIWEF